VTAAQVCRQIIALNCSRGSSTSRNDSSRLDTAISYHILHRHMFVDDAGLFGILVQFRPQATRAVQGRSSAMATYAYDQIDQARAALNAVSK
jgi:hypothetical protein